MVLLPLVKVFLKKKICLALIFNKTGQVKSQTKNTLYNYKIVNNQLKIYQTKAYKNNYEVKEKMIINFILQA